MNLTKIFIIAFIIDIHLHNIISQPRLKIINYITISTEIEIFMSTRNIKAIKNIHQCREIFCQ